MMGAGLPGEGNVIAGNTFGISLEKGSGGEIDHIEGNLIVHNWYVGVGPVMMELSTR